MVLERTSTDGSVGVTMRISALPAPLLVSELKPGAAASVVVVAAAGVVSGVIVGSRLVVELELVLVLECWCWCWCWY